MNSIIILDAGEKGLQVLVGNKLYKTLSIPIIEWISIPSSIKLIGRTSKGILDTKARICVKFFHHSKGPVMYEGVLERTWQNEEGHQCWEMTEPKVVK